MRKTEAVLSSHLKQMYYNRDSSICTSEMIKHYILSINPHSQHEWDKLTLRDPITGQRPDLAEMISQTVKNEAGSYLVAVNVEVRVLEESKLPQSKLLAIDVPKANQKKTPEELIASSA